MEKTTATKDEIIDAAKDVGASDEQIEEFVNRIFPAESHQFHVTISGTDTTPTEVFRILKGLNHTPFGDYVEVVVVRQMT